MSPIGAQFRSRIRQFPSLVNCCTIDWFDQWPDDALRSVALRFLDDIDLPDAQRGSVADVFVAMHHSALDYAEEYYETESRR
ncbi:dynein heavy chain, partial [Kipferlia bialata]|eukprot:g15119.t1